MRILLFVAALGILACLGVLVAVLARGRGRRDDDRR
jgi:hypothetical protein